MIDRKPPENPDILLRLLEIGRELTGEHDTQHLLRRIMDAAIEVTGAERGFLCVFERGEVRVMVARNFDQEEIRDAENKISQSIIQRVLKTGKPMLSADARSDHRLAESASIAGMKVRSIACIPLKFTPTPSAGGRATAPKEAEVIGLVYLDHRFESERFAGTDIHLLEVFGAQAALALRNAQMMAKLRELNANLETRLEESANQLLQTRSLLRDALADTKERYELPGIVYASKAMHQVLGLVMRIARRDLPILITGESGTGKELLARAIHQISPRSMGKFVAVNCGAIPVDLFESEFFGHKKGAFTGADRDRQGLVEMADGGTLFLDEVTELTPSHQVKLLRVLQEREVRRVGEDITRSVDVRVLSATNKDIAEEVQAGRFREDLYYRLCVFHIQMPALRDRPEDIPILVDHLFQKHASLVSFRTLPTPTTPTSGRGGIEVDPEVYSLLANYHWPGNIRELENEVKRALALSHGRLTPAELSPHFIQAPLKHRSFANLQQAGRTLQEIVDSVEREVIRETLDRHHGNKSKTAEELGISRNGLAMKMERLGLE